jgi:hypothetical protein
MRMQIRQTGMARAWQHPRPEEVVNTLFKFKSKSLSLNKYYSISNKGVADRLKDGWASSP